MYLVEVPPEVIVSFHKKNTTQRQTNTYSTILTAAQLLFKGRDLGLELTKRGESEGDC